MSYNNQYHCADCGKYVERGLRNPDGLLVCFDCFDETGVICADCGKGCWIHDTVETVDGSIVCQGCWGDRVDSLEIKG